MRLKVLAVFAAVVLCVTSVLPAAEEQPWTMPRELGAYVVIKSFNDFIDKADALIVKSTAGTSQEQPEGFLRHAVDSDVPLPLEFWKSDGEVRVYFDAAFKEAAAVISVDSYQGLIDALEKAEATTVEATESGEEGVAAAIVRTPRGRLAVLDNGDGTVCVSDTIDIISSLPRAPAVREWSAPPASGSDIDAHLNVNVLLLNSRMNIFEALARMDEKRDEAIESLVSSGLNPDVVAPLFDKFRAAIDVVLKETYDVGYAAMAADIDGGGLSLIVSMEAKPGSFVARLGEHWAALDQVEPGLANKISSGAIYIQSTAAVGDIFPGAPESFLTAAMPAIAQAYPEQKDAFEEKLRAYWALIPNPLTSVRYVRGQAMQDLYLTTSPDAEKCVESILGLFEVMNDMLDVTIAKDDYKGRFVTTTLEAGGQSYIRIQPELENAELENTIKMGLKLLYPTVEIDEALPYILRFYIAAKGDTLFILSGSGLTDDDLPRLMAMLEDGESALASAGYKRALGGLSTTQAAICAIDADEAVRFFLQQSVLPQLSTLGPIAIKAHDNTLANLPDTGAAIGIGVGATGKRATWQIIIPDGVVNGVIKQSELYLQELIAEVGRLMTEEAEQTDEEDSEGWEEEEEVVVDEEV